MIRRLKAEKLVCYYETKRFCMDNSLTKEIYCQPCNWLSAVIQNVYQISAIQEELRLFRTIRVSN
jgi:CRISPR/Cas system CMR-associated protein Cmr3 (group 5 of RAMP superfamily)